MTAMASRPSANTCGGCRVGDVVAAIGLHLADLFPDEPAHLVVGSGPQKRRRLITAGQALELLEAEATLVWIVASDMTRGVAPDTATKDRLIVAAARIGALRLEVYS